MVWDVRDASGGIWILDANGDHPTALTPLPSWAYGPVFSPDGLHIVYSDYYGVSLPPVNALQGAEVWVMNVDGTHPTRLTTTTQNGATNTGAVIRWSNRPAYSPDGTKIVYSSTQGGRSEIRVMNPDGTGRTQLTFNADDGLRMDEPSSDEPAWSPDGKSLMFDSSQIDPKLGGPASETWVMNADGSNQRVLLTHMYGEGRNPWINDPVQDGGTKFQCKN